MMITDLKTLPILNINKIDINTKNKLLYYFDKIHNEYTSDLQINNFFKLVNHIDFIYGYIKKNKFTIIINVV
jgi:hypothetical protein